MPLYCLCEIQRESSKFVQVPGAVYCAEKSDAGDTIKDMMEPVFPPIALARAMQCIKTGAAQVILGDNHGDGPPSNWTRNNPNVDVYECLNCGMRVVKEY